MFAASEPDAYDLWEEAITETGFDFADDYSERRWVIGKSQFHEVRDGFPRVVPPVPVGVNGIRYSIGLDACAPYIVDASIVDQIIAREAGSWTN